MLDQGARRCRYRAASRPNNVCVIKVKKHSADAIWSQIAAVK